LLKLFVSLPKLCVAREQLGAVLQKGKLIWYSWEKEPKRTHHGRAAIVQMASFRGRNHSCLREMVSALCTQFLIEQDHRFIKRLVKSSLGFFSCETAWRTLQGYEVMNMIRKGQREDVAKGNIR
jgi:DDE domain